MQQVEKITRSRAGCATCKKRRIKCDLTVPGCNNCTRHGIACVGYQRVIRWSDKYEKLKRPHQRASLPDHIQSEAFPRPSLHKSSSELSAASFALLQHELLPVSNDVSNNVWEQLDLGHDCFFNPVVQFSNHLGDISEKETDNIQLDGSHCRTTNTIEGDSRIAHQQDIAPRSDCWPGTDGGISTASSSDLLGLSSIFTLMETEADILTRHYFSVVCIINSGFDSASNPFRALVAELMSNNPVIYHCMLSMSAAHLHQQSRDSSRMVQEQRTEAIACMRTELSRVECKSLTTGNRNYTTSILLLGTLLLGMSSTWHDVSSLGTPYLYGVRSILKVVVSQSHKANTSFSFRSPSEHSFFVGAVAFWEALSSFHLDQDLSSIHYLDELCGTFESETPVPNPWTGSDTKLFVLVAKVGTITRQCRLLGRLITVSSSTEKSGVHTKLFDIASELESQIRNYRIHAEVVQETYDSSTPISHFAIMAQVYQITALLELYQVFPELVQNRNKNFGDGNSYQDSAQNASNHQHFLTSLAINILTIFSSIPSTSGTKAIQLLPLVIAGSALQLSTDDVTIDQALNTECMSQGIIALLNSRAAIMHWRSYVKRALSTVSRYVGLDSAQRGTRIVDEVWLRADMQAWSQKINPEDFSFVYWADVMRDERLETLLG